jgi:hypothetical protein
MPSALRYRIEDERSCIDIRLKTSRQLFDLRDPAPFRERDLDPAAVEHILSCVRELPKRSPIRLVLFFTDEPETDVSGEVVRQAIRSHFEYERDLMTRKIADNFRHGRLLAVVGVAILALFLTFAELSSHLPLGAVRPVLREGLVITGWVAMWRPVEVLLYDWWPMVEQRRLITKALEAPIDLRYQRGSVVPTQAKVLIATAV